MILVIAEKPSVAQSIAKVLGATSRKDAIKLTDMQHRARNAEIDQQGKRVYNGRDEWKMCIRDRYQRYRRKAVGAFGAAVSEHPHRCCVFEPIKARV